jgi:hypothetical protein
MNVAKSVFEKWDEAISNLSRAGLVVAYRSCCRYMGE